MKKIDPKTTALLIIDMQNDVVHPKGGWAAAGSPIHAKKQNTVAHIKAILERARRRRLPVIHILHAMTPGGRDARTNSPLFRNLVKSGNNAAGSWGAEPYAGLKPKQGDFIVYKQRVSGFQGTDLENKLKGLGVTRLLVTGAWTNFAVEGTSRDGIDLGYEVALVEDATCTINDEWQRASVGYALAMLSEVVSTKDVLAAL
ncbi:MAG: cysteine hydrolase family protein [Alphaproteobacteria bacterium]